MMRLLLEDASWPLYLPLIREALTTAWEMETPDGEPDWLARRVAGADALLATRLPPELRARARGLKALLYPGAGVIHSDPRELPLGCAMCNVFEHEAPMAEYVLMAILMHATGVGRIERSFREGRWDGSARVAGAPHGEAMGKSIGLIGNGHIAREIMARASAFGMRTMAVDSRSTADDLDRLLAASDYVVVVCPLTARTRGLLGARELARMRPDACLVNVARAEIVEERALYEALRDRRIGGAALDVWYEYPERAGEVRRGAAHPFHELDNVLLTPHFSAWTGPMLERRARRMAANLDHVARGEPLERVVLTGAWAE